MESQAVYRLGAHQSKCTQKNPSDRYQTVKELRYDLAHYKDLEIQAQRSYRRRLRIFGAAAACSVLCAAAGTALAVEAAGKQEEAYQNLVQMAAISTDSVEACSLYLEAVSVDDQRQEAYHGFYERAIEDGVFSEKEEELFLRLGISKNRHLQNFRKKNAQHMRTSAMRWAMHTGIITSTRKTAKCGLSAGFRQHRNIIGQTARRRWSTEGADCMWSWGLFTSLYSHPRLTDRCGDVWEVLAQSGRTQGIK